MEGELGSSIVVLVSARYVSQKLSYSDLKSAPIPLSASAVNEDNVPKIPTPLASDVENSRPTPRRHTKNFIQAHRGLPSSQAFCSFIIFFIFAVILVLLVTLVTGHFFQDIGVVIIMMD